MRFLKLSIRNIVLLYLSKQTILGGDIMTIIMHNQGDGKKEILDVTKISISPKILSIVDKDGNISIMEINDTVTFDLQE